MMDDFVWPPFRGTLTEQRPLADLTWLRVGGPADWFFQPADVEDLSAFLRALPSNVPVFPMGVGSNLIVRDGGVRGVVVRLGRGFNGIAVEGSAVRAGAAALDAHLARKAAEVGRDLTFLRTIPGSIGGAVRMNAGCYGSYVADVLREVVMVLRDGSVATVPASELRLAYRPRRCPRARVIVEAVFDAPEGDPAALAARMEEQLASATPPSRPRTGRRGSTFRNPGRIQQHGAGGRHARAQGLEADRRRGDARGRRGRGRHEPDARQLPDQRRGRQRRRASKDWARTCERPFTIIQA
jgi:UDP-N-acetylmuramate dehydrogenase